MRRRIGGPGSPLWIELRNSESFAAVASNSYDHKRLQEVLANRENQDYYMLSRRLEAMKQSRNVLWTNELVQPMRDKVEDGNRTEKCEARLTERAIAQTECCGEGGKEVKGRQVVF